MNAKLAKKLRKIARGLNLTADRKLVPSNAPRKYTADGDPLMPPFVLQKCERRAYKEAKKVYLGKPITKLEPGQEQTTARENITPSHKGEYTPNEQ